MPKALPTVAAALALLMIPAGTVSVLPGQIEPAARYAPAGACASCHAPIAAKYAQSAMARTFSEVGRAPAIEDYTVNPRLSHAPSARHYEMSARGGRVFQRRFQQEDGREVRSLEQEVTHVIGSGRHARSYLHREESGELTQLPVTWYTQERRWGMSPGYDQPKHYDFSRVIDRGCIACHNGYPAGADGFAERPLYAAPLPAGIDCQRCHGPGARHVELAGQGAAAAAVRGAIVNPGRLPAARQMDVCLQCHLETTSAKLPHALRRFGRGDYSFRPGDRLSDHLVQFDHAPGSGHEDKFEINSSGYRLLQSACFRKSEGKLTCATCHDAHGGEDHQRARREACLGCHTAHAERGREDCAGCHLPPRRAEDAVHVVMTDHRIQRPGPAGPRTAPLAEKTETYRGALAFYGPAPAPGAERDLYLGLALTLHGADAKQGLALLERGLTARGAAAPVEALAGRARALADAGRTAEAVRAYAQAVARRPDLAALRADYARMLETAGDRAGAEREYGRAMAASPDLPAAHLGLGRLAKSAEAAMDHFRRAAAGVAVRADALQNLGSVQAARGDTAAARRSFEQALAIDPEFAEAENGLGRAAAAEGRLAEALAHVRRAVALDGRYTEARYNLGRLLHASEDRAGAIAEYRRVIAARPELVEAHLSLGVALAELEQWPGAIAEFREVLRRQPGHPEAQRNLDLALELARQPRRR